MKRVVENPLNEPSFILYRINDCPYSPVAINEIMAENNVFRITCLIFTSFI